MYKIYSAWWKQKFKYLHKYGYNLDKTNIYNKYINHIINIQKSWKKFMARISLSVLSKEELAKKLLSIRIDKNTRKYLYIKKIRKLYSGITNFNVNKDYIIQAKVCELIKVHDKEHMTRFVKKIIITEDVKTKKYTYMVVQT